MRLSVRVIYLGLEAFEAGGWDALKSGPRREAMQAPNGEEGASDPGWLVGTQASWVLGGQVTEGALGGTGVPSSLLSCSKAQG